MTEEKTTETQPETTEQPKPTALVVQDNTSLACWFDTALFQQTQRASGILAKSTLVPERYQGHPSDCFMAIAMARRLGMEPLAIMPDLYVVHGTPGMSGKLVIALINSSKLYKGPLRFRFSKERPVEWCEAYAVDQATGEELSVRVTWGDVVSNGWNRAGSKWLTMREQMFRYRSAAWFSRAYCPEVGFGLLTTDEIVDDLSPEAKAGRVVNVQVIDAQPMAGDEAPKLTGQLLWKQAQAAGVTHLEWSQMCQANGFGQHNVKDPEAVERMRVALEARLAAPTPEPAAGPEFAEKVEATGQLDIEAKPGSSTSAKTIGIRAAGLLTSRIHASGRLGDQQEPVDYAIQVLGVATLESLTQLTPAQRDLVVASLGSGGPYVPPQAPRNDHRDGLD